MEFLESRFLGIPRDSERENENPRTECNFSEAIIKRRKGDEMRDIKTRNHVKDIKSFDRAATAAERIQRVAARGRRKAENMSGSEGENSPSSFAAGKSEEAIDALPAHASRSVRKASKEVCRTGKELRSLAKGNVKGGSRGITRGRVINLKKGTGSSPGSHTVWTSARKARHIRQGTRPLTGGAPNAIRKAASGLKTAARALKRAVQSARFLLRAVAAGGMLFVVVILIAMLIGLAISTSGGSSVTAGASPVSSEVEAFSVLIQETATQYGIGEYTELIKAVMMQESGGQTGDPMCSSESPYNTRYSNAPMSITDPAYSIECGVQALRDALQEAGVTNPVDLARISLALQGYNFGNGYISWAVDRDGGYTAENAEAFSDMMAERMGWQRYGDKSYVSHVLRYYPYATAGVQSNMTGRGNNIIVQVAASQVGNQGGQLYWSWYGLTTRSEWCAIFVSWCADQCGYLESGAIPRFSSCIDGMAWFQERGLWQDRSFFPAPGDIIFFDWPHGRDGAEHVAIVESCGGGTVYTIEGNNGDAVRRGSYPVGDGNILGYGVPEYVKRAT